MPKCFSKLCVNKKATATSRSRVAPFVNNVSGHGQQEEAAEAVAKTAATTATKIVAASIEQLQQKQRKSSSRAQMIKTQESG